VDEQPAQWERSYYQSIAPQHYARAAVASDPLVVDSPSYEETYQEPAAVSSDDLATPQTIVYQPIQIIAFSNPRRFGNRCRPAPHFDGAPATIAHRCPNRRNPHLSDTRVVASPNVTTTRVVASPNVTTPPCPPSQGFGPRGPVMQTGVTGGQQKRMAGPGSPGATRRALSVP
jgi:hypothetical protein